MDAQTGESLIGASVMIKELGVGTISNSYGFYSIAVASGSYTLLCSYIGYDDYSQPVELTEDFRIEIELAPGSEELDEIQVRGERKTRTSPKLKWGWRNCKPKPLSLFLH